MNKKYYTYIHKTLDTNEIFYVGKGCRNRAFSKQGRNIYWHRVANKHGFKVEINYCDSEESAYKAEAELINKYKSLNINLVNLTAGGDGLRNPSNETRLKMAKQWETRIVSKETRLKMSLARKGKPMNEIQLEKHRLVMASEKTKENIKKAVSTKEARLKNSLQRLGKPLPTEQRLKIAQKMNSAEMKEKLSKIATERMKNPQIRLNLSIANTGKKASLETRQKMSNSHKMRHELMRNRQGATVPIEQAGMQNAT